MSSEGELKGNGFEKYAQATEYHIRDHRRIHTKAMADTAQKLKTLCKEHDYFNGI